MKSRIPFAGLLAAATLCASQGAMSYGELDTSYTSATIPGWKCVGGSIAALPDDSVFVPITTDDGTQSGIARFLPDGSVDRGWAGGIAFIPALQLARSPYAIATNPLLFPTPDGGLIVVGEKVQRIRKDGTNDPSYGDAGFSDAPVGIGVSQIFSAALQADGGLVVLNSGGFVRILSNGRMDRSFGVNGTLAAILAPQAVYAWSVMDDSTVEVGTIDYSIGGPALYRFSRVAAPTRDVTGRLVPHAGLASWKSAAIVVDPQGGVVVAIQNIGGLLRYGLDGKPDRSYGLAQFTTFDASTLYFPDFSSGIPRLSMTGDGRWTVLQYVVQTVGFNLYVEFAGMTATRFGQQGGAQGEVAAIAGTRQYTRLNTGRLILAGGSSDCALTRYLTDNEPRVDGIIVEYYAPALQHYFLTLDTYEAALLDSNPQLGWTRTGQTFGAWQLNIAGSTPVCRFYGDPVIGPNSHFYTPEGSECAGLKATEQSTPPGVPVWHFEGDRFDAVSMEWFGCPGNLDPVYRVFNGTVNAANGPAHRYTTDPALYAQMQAQGWIGEGINFCVPMQSPR